MPGDEANYLHEAKRVAQGEVLYRDVFELTTPGWVFLVAALFRIFGTDIATAKVAIAVIHGLTATLLFFTCRMVGVRRLLAGPVSLLYVAIGVPAWPIASQHWLAAMLATGVLLACAWLPRAPAWWTVVPGIVLGLLVATHQRGVIVGAGVATWLVVDRWLDRRERGGALAVWLLAPVGCLVLGSLLVGVPLTLYLVATAGVEPLWNALVVHPWVYYRPPVPPWGQKGMMAGLFSFPLLLAYAPVVLVVPVVRLGVTGWRSARTAPMTLDGTRLVLFATILCVAAILSIRYYPDTAHIAFISPFFLVVVAQNLEWLAGFRTGSRWLRVLWHAAVIGLVVAIATHLARDLRLARGFFPLRHDTAFGRIAQLSPAVVAQVDYLRQLLALGSRRTMFGYPGGVSHLCLMTDARNPTRYELYNPYYNTPVQVREVLDLLVNDPPAYFIVNGKLRPDDPIQQILDRHYSVLLLARRPDEFTIFEPRARAPAAPGRPE